MIEFEARAALLVKIADQLLDSPNPSKEEADFPRAKGAWMPDQITVPIESWRAVDDLDVVAKSVNENGFEEFTSEDLRSARDAVQRLL